MNINKYTPRNEKQICSTSKHSNEVLDKEVKNYKEKEILEYRHQTPVYNKPKDRPNSVINLFPENDNPFWQ